MTQFTIGIDIGTTATKAVLFSPAEGVVAQASRAVDLMSPSVGRAEASIDQWTSAVVDTVRNLVASNCVAPESVAAIAATGMAPAVVICGSSRVPLRPAILQNDSRAVVEIRELRAALPELDFVNLTGSSLTQQSVAPTTMWLGRNEPSIWADTRLVLGSYDWVLTWLGAEPHVEFNWAIESGLFRLDGSMLEEVFGAAGLDRGRVPPVKRSGSVVGGLSSAAAMKTGLPTGTPLVVGGADHVLSAFSAGVADAGDWLVKLGGAGDILVASEQRLVDPRLYIDAHPQPGLWLPNGCMATSGSLVRWLQVLVGGEDLAVLDREASSRLAADLLCLPYFLGEKSPLHDPDLRGSFSGLRLDHTRADLYRSTLEAVAFGFRHHVDIFEDLGVSLGRAMVANGGSRSSLWKQILADVLGVELFPVLDHPGASLGAAIVAAIGVGLLDEWSVSGFIELGAPIMPDPGSVGIYDNAYVRWRDLGEALAPISKEMASGAARRSTP